MHERRIPEWLRHAPAPSIRGFAVLAGTESIARGILTSVFPLVIYQAIQDALVVSQVYFFIGVASLILGLMLPYLIRYVPRRSVYVAGTLLFIAGTLLTTYQEPLAVIAGLCLTTFASVITFICFNAYILDYVSKIELGKFETSRLFYSATGWTVGPAFGVFLYKWWPPAPFFIAVVALVLMLLIFLIMRLGNGKLITKIRDTPVNPLDYIQRFFKQPRLITGWIFAVIRSCGWWIYVIYLPIYAIQNGLGEQLGGIVLSITNGALFLSPLMFQFMQRNSVRVAVRTGFLMSGLLFLLAGPQFGFPMFAVLSLMMGSFFLILLDVCGGLPFLLAVKPSERTEMSAIYSSFRDVSGILTPGTTWLILLIFPISGVFVAGGLGLLCAWVLAGKLSPKLGKSRSSIHRRI
jgi:MFS transporter, ACDE family, multidrug resistance protein